MALVQDLGSSQGTGGTQTIAAPAATDGSFLHMTVARWSQDFTAWVSSMRRVIPGCKPPATATCGLATVHHFYCFRASSITAATVQWSSSGSGLTTHVFLREFDNDLSALLVANSISMDTNQIDLSPASVIVSASDVLIIGSLDSDITNRTYTLQNTTEFTALQEHKSGSLETCNAYGVCDAVTWGRSGVSQAAGLGLRACLPWPFHNRQIISSLAALAWLAF